MSGGSEADLGHEALAALVGLMENERADTVVILAGYTDVTLAMVDMNPGLASRLGRTNPVPGSERSRTDDDVPAPGRRRQDRIRSSARARSEYR